MLTNREHRISYDSTGRLISKEVLDLSVTGNADKWLHSLEYNYDLNNNVSHFAFADRNTSFVTAYEYGKDNLLSKTTLPSNKEIGYTYDNLGRLTGKNLNTTNAVNTAYTYHGSERDDEVVDGVTKSYTTFKIETETVAGTKYKYAYDVYGNITHIYSVSSNDVDTLQYLYDYDEYNQLTDVYDYVNSQQYEYEYDESGNITSRNRYAIGASGVPTATLDSGTYSYGDSQWKDLLTSYNGQTITYDAVGNPLNYRDGISLTWQNGRELATFANADTSVAYTYDVDGMRTGKTITSGTTTETVEYVYENGQLLQMRYNHMIFNFSYDAYGSPVSMAYYSTPTSNPVYYYYALNSQGDVVGLYNSTGSLYAKYTYDAYGNLISLTNGSGSPINIKYSPAKLNPLRYRGYVYDNETGFYYLQTRYYDSTTCRFVNADDVSYIGMNGFNSYNLFTYCVNNPIMELDSTGCWSWGVFADIVTTVVAAVIGVAAGIKRAASTFKRTLSIKKAVTAGITTSTVTSGAVNNTVNTVYYNHISDGESSLEAAAETSTYTERYVTRWERLDYTKKITEEPEYNLNAWRFNSEYSAHMYGWYATGWAINKNIPFFSDMAKSSKKADIYQDDWDERLSINTATIIFGILGL